MRPDSSSPIVALRAALAGPYPQLRTVALRLLHSALSRGPTIGKAAESLGIARRALERLRVDYPEIDTPPKKSPGQRVASDAV
jgi:hypothetical protein